MLLKVQAHVCTVCLLLDLWGSGVRLFSWRHPTRYACIYCVHNNERWNEFSRFQWVLWTHIIAIDRTDKSFYRVFLEFPRSQANRGSQDRFNLNQIWYRRFHKIHPNIISYALRKIPLLLYCHLILKPNIFDKTLKLLALRESAALRVNEFTICPFLSELLTTCTPAFETIRFDELLNRWFINEPAT